MRSRLVLFNVQPFTLLVGQPGGFPTETEFYQFAAHECGFEAVSMPDGFINIAQAVESPAYRDDLQAKLRCFGLKDGLVRLEMHVVGQNMCVAPYRVKRTGHFLAPDKFRTIRSASMEAMASAQLRRVIDASAAFGFKTLPGFCGGRGFAAAMAKWPAWPKRLPEWVMALLALKWNDDLEYAADKGVTVTFEFGHPENDILTGENFVMFYGMLSSKARTAVGINADASHFLNIGINPMSHFQRAASTGCRFTNHYKWGASVDRGDGTASTYGGWRNWSEASTTFFTFATVGPDSLACDFHAFNMERAKAQGDDVLDVVYEGEDATIINPMQAMKVGAYNCRAAINGIPFIKLDGVIPEADFVLTKPHDRGPVQLIGPTDVFPSGQGSLEPWSGGPFDAAFDSPLKPWDLLEMTRAERRACRKILSVAGRYEAMAIKD